MFRRIPRILQHIADWLEDSDERGMLYRLAHETLGVVTYYEEQLSQRDATLSAQDKEVSNLSLLLQQETDGQKDTSDDDGSSKLDNIIACLENLCAILVVRKQKGRES